MNLPHEAGSSAVAEAATGDFRTPKTIGDLHKAITMAQIAKAAAVSQGAISSLLNDRDYGIRVSEKTRERVFKVCREMGYIPNDLRAVVRMYPELGDFCLLVSSKVHGGLLNSVVSRVAAAAMAAIVEPSQPITFSVYDEGLDYLLDPNSLPHAVRSGVCSKFLLLGRPSASLMKALNRRGSPVVALGHEAPLPDVLSIVPDCAAATKLGIEHLVSLGHRQIAVVAGPLGASDPRLQELLRGIDLGCEAAALPRHSLQILHGDLSEDAGVAAAEELFVQRPGSTAAFCLSDDAAAGLLAGARARNVDVPTQFSVLGCSDDVRARFTQPQLTTVHLPIEEMAAMGITEIERLVRGPLSGESRKILLAPYLAVRESTAAPR